jgi:hypothetical protein
MNCPICRRPATRVAQAAIPPPMPALFDPTDGEPGLVEFDPSGSQSYRIAESPWCGDDACLTVICEAAKNACRERDERLSGDR